MRHDKFCTHLHYSLCEALGTETTDKWYTHTHTHTHTHMSKPVCEEGDVTVLWNQAVHTDREVTANKPDIIIKNKKIHTLIDVAIPADRNVVKKEAEKKLKSNSLCIEMPPTGSNIGALYRKLYTQSKVLLRMGEFVARNM